MNSIIKLNENTKKNLLFKNNKFYSNIKKALDLVEEYIINKQLILVGGMSIDYALKLKGDKIYDNDDVPDYDVFSPEFHRDAYNLVELLYEKIKEESISVINAMHISTMRVRIHFTTVADITYIPIDIYKQLPTLNYNSKNGVFRIIHPHYQMINQHRSLYLPFENTPFDTIFYRWKKDMKRFDLLNKYYSIKDDDVYKLSIKEFIHIKMDIKLMEGSCLCGISAFLFWLKMAENMGYKKNIEIGDFYIDENFIEYKIPIFHPYISLFNNDIMSIRKKFEDVINIDEYYPYLDIINNKLIINNKYELINSNGYLISSYKYNDIYIVNIQHCLLYILYHYIFSDKNKDYYKLLYNICLDILLWSIDKYIEIEDIDIKKKYRIFLPSIETFGNKNESISMSIFMSSLNKKLGIEKNSDLQLNLPKKFYMEKSETKLIPKDYYEYEPYNETLYKIDGKKIEKKEELL